MCAQSASFCVKFLQHFLVPEVQSIEVADGNHTVLVLLAALVESADEL